MGSPPIYVQGQLEDYPLCNGCDAKWQEDTALWKAFAAARSVATTEPLPVLQNGQTHGGAG